MFKAIIRYLSSLRCTLLLIISLGSMFVLSFVFPQKELLKKQDYLQMKAHSPLLFKVLEPLGMTEIHISPVTLILWFFFFINLALVMRKRVPLVMKRIEFPPLNLDDPRTATSYPVRMTMQVAHLNLVMLENVLKKAGYRTVINADRLYGVKNRFSPLATLLFHLSFFLILLAGVVTSYTKFVGYVDLAAGESFHGELGRYKASPRLPKVGGIPAVAFSLESIKPVVEENTAVGLQVVLRNSSGTLHTADINRPFKNGATSVLVNDLGVAPLVIIQDPNGKELDGAFVKLDVAKGKKDHFALAGYQIDALFFPDHDIIDGMDTTRSAAFANPALRLEVRKDGRLIAARTIKPGETVELDGNRLTVREMPFWTRLLVVKQYGDGIAYAGFIIATFALCWRLLWFRRELICAVEEKADGPLVHLACRSEFYKTSAQAELDKIRLQLHESSIS